MTRDLVLSLTAPAVAASHAVTTAAAGNGGLLASFSTAALVVWLAKRHIGRQDLLVKDVGDLKELAAAQTATLEAIDKRLERMEGNR